MTLIDQLQDILERMVRTAQEHNFGEPKTVRINPTVLREISHIHGWFQHDLFYVQDEGATRHIYGHNPTATSPVISRVHVLGKVYPVHEDTDAFLVSLDYGRIW